MATIISQLVDQDYIYGVETDMMTGEPIFDGALRQTFTLTEGYNITTISVKMARQIYVGGHPVDRTFTVTLHAANVTTGETTGSALGSASASSAGIGAVAALVVFTFAPAVALAAGTYSLTISDGTPNYWGDFVADPENPPFWTVQGLFVCELSSASQYSGGKLFTVYSGGPAAYGGDLTFTVEGTLSYVFAPPVDLVVHKFLVCAANGKLYYET